MNGKRSRGLKNQEAYRRKLQIRRRAGLGLIASAVLVVCTLSGSFLYQSLLKTPDTRQSEYSEGQKQAGRNAEPAEGRQEVYLNDIHAGENGSQTVSGISQEKAEINQLDTAITMASRFTETNEEMTVLENGAVLREDCHDESPVMTELTAEEEVIRTGKNEAWSRVSYQGMTGYIASDSLGVLEHTQITEAAVPGAEAPALFSSTGEEDGLVHAASEGTAQVVSNGRIVVLDAGHQGKEDTGKEPAGPDSEASRQKMPAGAVGSFLGIRECDVTLSVAKKAERILTERGYTVIMARESNDVNVSCAKRTELANESGAGALIHIHSHSQDSPSVSGVLATCQSASNPYNSGQHSSSYALSRYISDSVSQAAGARNRGVQQTDTMSEINWSQVPVTVLEIGFLSNQQEELLLSQEEYQERIALGIADGIDRYFASGQ